MTSQDYQTLNRASNEIHHGASDSSHESSSSHLSLLYYTKSSDVVITPKAVCSLQIDHLENLLTILKNIRQEGR